MASFAEPNICRQVNHLLPVGPRNSGAPSSRHARLRGKDKGDGKNRKANARKNRAILSASLRQLVCDNLSTGVVQVITKKAESTTAVY